MKKKNISILIVLIISIGVLFLTAPIVLADPDMEGSGNEGSGSGGSADGCGTWNQDFRLKVNVYNEKKEKKGKDIIVSYSSIPGWIKLISNNDNNWSSNPTKLYDYYNIPYNSKTGDYTGLKKLISTNGITLESKDYIIMQPQTTIGGNWYSFRDIVSNASDTCGGWIFYKNYKAAALVLANAAKIGSDITVGGITYTKTTDPDGICHESDYDGGKRCGYNNNKYIGYGILVVRANQMNIEPPKGSITFTKVDGSDTSVELRGAKFNLYDSNYTHIKTCETSWDGICTFNDLVAGTYYLKEATAPQYYDLKEVEYPSGYTKNNNGYITITLTAGQDLNIGQVKNYKTCVSEFNGYGSGITRANRLELFKKYGFEQLLNFNVTNAGDACKSGRDCGIKTTYTCSEISVKYEDFDGDNLSCHISSIDYNEPIYCVAEFTFNTSFLKTLESKVFKSGQLIYIPNLPTLRFKKRCYNLDGTLANNPFILEHYMNVDNFKINGLSEKGDKLTITNYSTSENTPSSEYTFRLTRKACISKIDGKEVDEEKCNPTFGGYNKGKFLYKEALVPKFTNSGELKVYPSLELIDVDGCNDKTCKYKSTLEADMRNEGVSLTIKNSDKCTFEFEKEIINPKLELMFRIIDTTNPFPGNKGVGRLLGANWCDDEHLCTIKYSKYVDDKIFESPNSKGLVTVDGTTTQATPKYKIVLNANRVKEIREYNKEYSYEEVEYECAGNNCENKFLKQYQSYFQIYKGQ